MVVINFQALAWLTEHKLECLVCLLSLKGKPSVRNNSKDIFLLPQHGDV